MVNLSIEVLLKTAVDIFLFEEKAITLTFSVNSILIKFPTTRRLAEYLDVPHYYILPYFGMMEEQNLITRAERVGIMTTDLGTKYLIGLMKSLYPVESAAIIGDKIFCELLCRIE